MVNSIIELVIGWFLIDKVPSMVGASGTLATIIKLVGVVFLISGFVHLVGRFV